MLCLIKHIWKPLTYQSSSANTTLQTHTVGSSNGLEYSMPLESRLSIRSTIQWTCWKTVQKVKLTVLLSDIFKCFFPCQITYNYALFCHLQREIERCCSITTKRLTKCKCNRSHMGSIRVTIVEYICTWALNTWHFLAGLDDCIKLCVQGAAPLLVNQAYNWDNRPGCSLDYNTYANYARF